ncbi:MAG: hypothetical protein U5L96_20295 [Owenweeksia sp.]|nr:hypothetical protein [Owenweeksia sp.]
MDRGNQQPKRNSFDANHLGIQQLQIELQDVELGDEKASFYLQNLAFAERSGFRINQFQTNIKLSNQKLELNSFDLVTGHSRLTSKAEISYESIDSLLSNPSGNSGFNLDLKPQTRLSLKDAFYFNDSLRQDSLLNIWAEYPVQIETSVKGKLGDLVVDKLIVNGLGKSRLSLKGEIDGLPDTDQLSFDIPSFQISTSRSDLALVMDTAGLPLPATISVNSRLEGSLEDLITHLDLKSDLGQFEVEARLQNLPGQPKYKLQLAALKLQAGKLTATKELEPVSFELNLDGSGSTLEELTAQVELNFQKLKFKGYDYSKLKLNSSIAKKNAKINLSHLDPNLNFNLKLEALLDTLNATARLDLDVQGADLRDLNLRDNRLKLAFKLKSSFSGKPSDFTTSLNLTNGIFISGETSYRLDSTHASLQNREKSTDLKIDSEIIEGQLSGNTSIQNLISALEGYLEQGMGGTDKGQPLKNDSLQMQGDFLVPPVRFTFRGSPSRSLNRWTALKLKLCSGPGRRGTATECVSAPN